jgi:ABC-type lipoprotein release transport system permease subunit
VGAIVVILAARSRRHLRGWLVLTLLVAIGTGFVLAAVTAGRRADSAFPRFVASHGYDAIVYSGQPLPLTRLPSVASAVETRALFTGQPSCSCGQRISSAGIAVRDVAPADLPRVVKLVAGRMPDQSDAGEVLASFTLQRDYGIRPGTVIRLPLAAPSQSAAIQAALNGGPIPVPTGPVEALRVTGIVAAENEFPAGQEVAYDLYPTQAFAVATRGTPTLPIYYVQLRHGRADLAQFEAAVTGQGDATVVDLDQAAAAVTAAIHPQALGWWVLAVLAAIAAIFVMGQALGRQAAAESADSPALAALGLRSGQFLALDLLRTLAVGTGGAVGGVAAATLLSPLAPAGDARLADPAPGLAFDWPVAAAGGAAAVVLVVALGLPPALRSAGMYSFHAVHRRSPAADAARVARPSRIAAAAAAVGLPVAAVLGIGHAVGRGARAAPVLSALAGAVAAMTALCATAVFGASLAHLVASPELYGDPFQAVISSSAPGANPPASLVSELIRDPAVDRITTVTVPAITVGTVTVRALATAAVRGLVLLSTADGRLPAGDQEIALGATTMRNTGTHIGTVVRVTVTSPDGTPRAAWFRVVGTVPLPGEAGTGGLGTGAVLTSAGYLAAQCPPSLGPSALRRCHIAAAARPADAVLMHVQPGPAGEAALARYARQNPNSLATPTVPTALVSFGEAANFPLLMGIVVAVCGIAALAHLMVVSVARRRRESGLLKALGFIRGQLAAIVFWQAATAATVGIVVGVPLGLATGRAIWRAFAREVGVVPVTVLPGWLIGALGGGFLIAALVIAVVPALTAARARASAVLRAE